MAAVSQAGGGKGCGGGAASTATAGSGSGTAAGGDGTAVADASGSLGCGGWVGVAASTAAGGLEGAGAAVAGPDGSACEGMKTAGLADEKPQLGHTHSAFLKAPSTAAASSPRPPQNVLVMMGAGVTGKLGLSSTAGKPENTNGSGRSTATAGRVSVGRGSSVDGGCCACVPEDMMFRM
jgi:hypothetical protein